MRRRTVLVLEEVRQAFGAAEIEAGINENIYRLEQWHRSFVQAGLELEAHTITHAYNAVYVKNAAGAPRTISLEQAEAELFDRFYDATLVRRSSRWAGPSPAPDRDAGPRRQRLAGRMEQRWASCPSASAITSISRHAERRETVALGNPRASLGYLWPGRDSDVRIAIAVPEARETTRSRSTSSRKCGRGSGPGVRRGRLALRRRHPLTSRAHLACRVGPNQNSGGSATIVSWQVAAGAGRRFAVRARTGRHAL